MTVKRIGVAVSGPNSDAVMANISEVEKAGIPAVWLTTGGAGLDGLTIFAAATQRFETTLFGTSIVPTFPRHPIVVAQQVQVLSQLAPDRFRLGVGPSHRPTMEAMFGTNFHSPLGHLKEYVQILKTLFQTGAVDFSGKYYEAHAQIGNPINVPVMASALRAKSFEMCGEEADAAISWVCPQSYLENIAVPAITRGAASANRQTPGLIAHAPICVHENVDEVKIAVQQQLSNYPKLPFYQQMFHDAGFPEAFEGVWSDGMINGTVISGTENEVAERIYGLFDMGATEILVSVVQAGESKNTSHERTLKLLGDISRDL